MEPSIIKNINLKIKPLARSTQVKHTKHKRIETSIQVATCDPDGGGWGEEKKRKKGRNHESNAKQYLHKYIHNHMAGY